MTPYAKKGSQRWLQLAVDRAPHVLNQPLTAALGRPGPEVEWISPRREHRFQEFRDEDVCIRCELTTPLRRLADFWPRGGPVWDGLARVGRDVVLLEAKAHIPEIVSPRSRAGEPARGRIVQSMREVQQSLSPKSVGYVDWTGTFYQYANRVAFLHFFREQNRQPVHLVNLYFVNAQDVHGPTSIDEWKGALTVVKSYLGLGRHRLSKYTHDLFVAVNLIAAHEHLDLRPAN